MLRNQSDTCSLQSRNENPKCFWQIEAKFPWLKACLSEMKFLYYVSLTLLSHIFLPSPFTFEMYSALAKTSSSEVKGSFTIDLNGTNVISRLQYTVRKKYIIVIVESMRNIYTIWQFHCKTSGTNQLSRVFPTTHSRQRRRTQSPAPRCLQHSAEELSPSLQGVSTATR